MRPPQPALFTTGHESPASSWHVLSPGWRAVCTQTSRPMADARMVRPVAEFDLSSAVGVGGLTAAAGIAIRSASCQQPRVAALTGAAVVIGLCAVARRRHRPSDLRVFCSHAPHSPRADCAPHQQDTCSCKQCENLVAPLSGGAALEEAAAWEAQQMEAARHAKELQSQYWGRQRQQRARRDWRRLSG